MKKCAVKLMIMVCILMLCGCAKADPELNENYSPYNSSSTYKSDSKYYSYYAEKIEKLSIETVLLSMGLDWYVDQYDMVYRGEEKYFYVSAFDTPSISTNELLNMYNADKDNLYYLKPFLDCYVLMDKNDEPSDEDMKVIKESILYALEFYYNGKDFVGKLDE